MRHVTYECITADFAIAANLVHKDLIQGIKNIQQVSSCNMCNVICSVLQCVAVCCSVLQCVAVCCSVLQCVAVCCSVLRCLRVCCGEYLEGLFHYV